MLSGAPPFTGRTDEEVFDSIMTGKYSLKGKK